MDIIDKIDVLARNKKRIAYNYEESIMTYYELAESSNALASFLVHTYWRDKTPIIVYGNKQVEMLVCFFACIKSGHTCILLDSSYPHQRTGKIIESLRTKLVFSIDPLIGVPDHIRKIEPQEIQTIVTKYKGFVPEKIYSIKANETCCIAYSSENSSSLEGEKITLACLENYIPGKLLQFSLAEADEALFVK